MEDLILIYKFNQHFVSQFYDRLRSGDYAGYCNLRLEENHVSIFRSGDYGGYCNLRLEENHVSIFWSGYHYH